MEFTYDDMFIVPQFSEVRSRFDVNLTPSSFSGMTIPIAVANMPPVAGKRMAETVARRGGLTILPQYLSSEKIEKAVRFLKTRHPVFETALTLSVDDTIQTALGLIGKRAYGVAYVVDNEKKLVGTFSASDAKYHNKFGKVGNAMKTNVKYVASGFSFEEFYDFLDGFGLNVLPVVDDDLSLLGVVTRSGIVRSTIYTPALGRDGNFLVAASVGVREGAYANAQLLVDLGVDVIVVDAAHGHQRSMLEMVGWLRERYDGFLVAGNIVTKEATRDLVGAGVDAVKVGVGPGATCTTRMMTGVGRPQFSAVRDCVEAAGEEGAEVWADGGIKYPRDVALAIAAGAACVVVGTLFAGTHESAADLHYDEEGRAFKELYGTSSNRAVDHITRGLSGIEKAKRLYLDEGVSHSRAYLRPGLESAEDILDKLTSGLRSAMTYSGVNNISDFQDKVIVGIQSPSGYGEGKPRVGEWFL